MLHKLKAYGIEGRYVGGWVRDRLLGRPVTDCDIAVAAEPSQITDWAHRCGLGYCDKAAPFGTVIIYEKRRKGGPSYQLTALREDVETDGRHAVVRFGKDWFNDACRRDLTFNALYEDVEGNIYDPFEGRKDLAEGKVRFIGDPRMRIREDYLRILRFFRFYAYYGETAPEESAIAACADLAHGIEFLSKPRIRQEFFKLLAAADPWPALHMMQECGILSRIFEEHTTVPDPRLCEYAVHPLDRLKLLAPAALTFDRLCHLLCLTRMEMRHLQMVEIYKNTANAEEVWLRCGSDVLRSICSLRGEPMDQRYAQLPPDFPLQGRDLTDYLPAGKKLGMLLNLTYAWWVEQSGVPNREHCLAFALKELKNGRY